MKIFYHVNYRVWGADRTYIKWFDNKEEAKEFSRTHFADKPIMHRYTNHKSIAEAEQNVLDSKFY